MDDTKTWNVYMYFDVDEDITPIYVGITFRGNRRFWEHQNVCNNRHLRHKIEKLATEGKEPFFGNISEGLSFEEAIALEKRIIAYFGREHYDPRGTLYNITLGGEGSLGHRKAQHPNTTASIKAYNRSRRGQGMHPNLREALQPYYEARIGKPAHPKALEAVSRTGEDRSAKQRERDCRALSVARSKITKETHKKISESLKGKPWTAARRAAQKVRTKEPIRKPLLNLDDLDI